MTLSKLSRRQFLKRTSAFGIALGFPVAAKTTEIERGTAALIGTSLGMPDGFEAVGRAFSRTPVFASPSLEAPSRSFFQPDSVYPLEGLAGDGWWYQVENGYVPREAVQPILPYHRPAPLEGEGWVEMIAPFTAVREYCAGSAPIMGRLVFGAVVYVHDRLRDDFGILWYMVSAGKDSNSHYGWATAAHFRAFAPTPPALQHPTLWIDSHRMRMAVYDGDKLIGESAIYAPPLLPGSAVIQTHHPAKTIRMFPSLRPSMIELKRPNGAPLTLCGANWHNRFGQEMDATEAGRYPSPFVELPIFTARWLYGLVNAMRQKIEIVIE